MVGRGAQSANAEYPVQIELKGRRQDALIKLHERDLCNARREVCVTLPLFLVREPHRLKVDDDSFCARIGALDCLRSCSGLSLG